MVKKYMSASYFEEFSLLKNIKIILIKMQNSDLNYNKYFTIGKNLNLKKDFTSENSKK